MLGPRTSQSFRTLLVAFSLIGAVTLFPPRENVNSVGRYSAGRGFLFDPEFSSKTVPTSTGGRVELYQINAGRLLAEALLIFALAGLQVIYVWIDDTNFQFLER